MIASTRAGFTLIELLLSVTIIGMVAGLSLPVYASFQTRNELDIATTTIADAARRAQSYARAGNGDSQWGVAVQSNTIVLFKGATYASRDTSYDETSPIPATITSSGQGEVAFTKLNGLPSTTGSINLTSSTNDTRTVTINAKGMVTY